jgi:recombination protein RecA
MQFMKTLHKSMNKMDGVTTDDSPPRYWFGSGNVTINRIIGGSFKQFLPQGRITAFAGASGAGKSFLLANVLKQAQSEGAMIFVLDSENAFDRDFAGAIGIDTSSEHYHCVRVTTIDNVTKIISTFIKGYKEDYGEDLENAPKVVIAIDSADMLMTNSEHDKFKKGDGNADQGQQAKQLKSMLKPFVNTISNLNISIIFTKQVYPANQEQIMAGNGKWVVTESIKYCASQIVLISKLKLKDKDAITGIRMKVEGYKTRFTKPFQTVTVEVPYDEGMSQYSGLLDAAIGLGVVRGGTWNYYGDPEVKFQSGKFEDHAEAILKLCEEKSNVFFKISDELDDLEVIE